MARRESVAARSASTSTRPWSRPRPRAPTARSGCSFANAASRAARRAPSSAARATRPSRSTTPSTAFAAAHASGLPTYVPPWSPRLTVFATCLGTHERAHRKAAADALAERHRVRRHAVVLPGEPVAGAADAGLDLVEDQERAVLAAELAQAGEVAGRRDVDAALALHRLDDERGRRAVDRGARGVEIAERHDGLVAQQRLVGIAVLRLADHLERAERAAVERVLGRDEAHPAGGAVRELQRAVDRLGARVHDERARRAPRRRARPAARSARAAAACRRGSSSA